MAERYRNSLVEPAPVRWLLIAVTLLFLGVFLLLPLIIVFVQALSHEGARDSSAHQDAMAAGEQAEKECRGQGQVAGHGDFDSLSSARPDVSSLNGIRAGVSRSSN